MKKYLKIVVILFLSCVFGAEAYSEDTNSMELAAVRSEITTIVQQLVREIDPAAQVKVTISKKKANRKVKLPGTPFALDNVNISGPSVESKFEVVSITVFSSTGTLPTKVKQLIQEMVSSYAKVVKLSSKPLPDDFLEARKKTISESRGTEVSRSWESSFLRVLTQVSDLFKSTSKIELDNIGKNAFLVGISFVIFVLLIVIVWMWMQRRTLAVIERGFRGVAAALETGAGNTGREPSTSAAVVQTARRQMTHATTADSARSFSVIPENSLLALLSDCYWSAQDSYGAFLWRRIPIERKISLIERMPELSEYGRFLLNIGEKDLGLEQDPSYLQPLSLWHLDMANLTEIVRHNPTFINILSPIRLSALHLKPTERLALYESCENNPIHALPVLPDIKCTPRKLKQTLRIDIQSDEDEIEILSMNEPTLALIEQVPSLGWLLQLPPEKVSEILLPLSARDIATAWVGPKEVLVRVAQHIGEKKFEIMKSHLARLSPSRDAPTFLSIHRRAVEEIQRARIRSDEVSGHAA